jgi:hypothetical protein
MSVIDIEDFKNAQVDAACKELLKDITAVAAQHNLSFSQTICVATHFIAMVCSGYIYAHKVDARSVRKKTEKMLRLWFDKFTDTDWAKYEDRTPSA